MTVTAIFASWTRVQGEPGCYQGAPRDRKGRVVWRCEHELVWAHDGLPSDSAAACAEAELARRNA
jgi:hypothetical protein